MPTAVYRGIYAPRGSSLAEKLAFHSAPARGGCRIWKGNPDKPAFLRWGGNLRPAPKLAWENKHGPVPPGHAVHQKCGHERCISLRHLYLGRKGGEGENHPKAKLTAAEALFVREMVGHKIKTQAELARMFGVGTATISDVIHRRTWKNV